VKAPEVAPRQTEELVMRKIIYWVHTSTDDHARTFAPFWWQTPKVVVSRTLDKAGWDARVIGKDFAEEIAELKRQPGIDHL
jgi:Zn-dependent M28 family amino/carboxypeptidase